MYEVVITRSQFSLVSSRNDSSMILTPPHLIKEQRISTRFAVRISLRSWDTRLGSCLVPVIRQLVERGVSARWIGVNESAINNSARSTLDCFASKLAGALSA